MTGVINCLSCNAPIQVSNSELFDTRFGIDALYTIAKCESCGLEQTAPMPSQSELNSLYERHYNFSGESNTQYTQLRSKFINSFLYRFWLAVDGDISFQKKSGSGKLLDVGCNEGRGLEFFHSHGFVAEGLELNSKAADVARAKGFVVHGSTLEGFAAQNSYDVIVLSNVLEHSLSPRDMLRNIHRLLSANGQVWISCPNSRSWLRSVFGRYWINWHVPFHVTHFSQSTLQDMLRKSDFDVVELKHETPALWVAHSAIARMFAKHGTPTIQLRSAPLVAALILLIRGLFFPLMWLGNLTGRGDCLVVIARKI